MKLIKGGTVVTATETMQADVLVDGEKVVAIASPEHHQWGESAEVIDASGKLVMPGGVDVHTHMELPFGGTYASRHVRHRHPGGGLGRHHHHHRLRRADLRPGGDARVRGVDGQGGGQLRQSTTGST